jgi:hypothetical protein
VGSKVPRVPLVTGVVPVKKVVKTPVASGATLSV